MRFYLIRMRLDAEDLIRNHTYCFERASAEQYAQDMLADLSKQRGYISGSLHLENINTPNPALTVKGKTDVELYVNEVVL